MTDTHDSYLQSDARQEAISAQKELFLRGLPVDTTVVSDFVLRSWQRSRLAGVDPETTVRKKVDETIFRHILAANADLLESSRVIMKELFSSLVSGAGSMILSTAECISLHMETSGRDGDTYPSSKPGMITTEQLRGTNGIGTCVAERRPIEIIGAEHYLTVGHRWSCSAAPIFDSVQLIAVLNVSHYEKCTTPTPSAWCGRRPTPFRNSPPPRSCSSSNRPSSNCLRRGGHRGVPFRRGVKPMNSKAASMLGASGPAAGRKHLQVHAAFADARQHPHRRSPYHGSGGAVPLGIRFAVLFLFGHVPDQRGLRGAHVPGGPAYAGIRGTRRRVEGRVHV